jgi:lipopolysaccharide transport system permease protein
MREIVHSAAAELIRPGPFLRHAAQALRLSLKIAPRLLRANLRIRYRRSWLGYAWLFVPSVGAALLASLLIGRRMAGMPGGAIPYPVFVLVGMILWQLLVETLGAPLQQLGGARHILARSPVPHEAFVLAGAAEALLGCVLRLALLGLPVLLWFGAAPGAELLLLPLALLALALLGLALGMLLAPFGLLYDDVGSALTLLTGFWFFLSPILYPAGRFDALALNPATPLIEAGRALLTGGDAPVAAAASVAAGAFLLLALAWLLYRLAQPHLVARFG